MSIQSKNHFLLLKNKIKQSQSVLVFFGTNLIHLGTVGTVALGVLGISEGFVFSRKNAVNAQEVTADVTTGTVVESNGLLTPRVPGSPRLSGSTEQQGFVITGGTQRQGGNSLFHSFDTFSPNTIPTEFRLDDSQSGIVNIFSRVTGSDLNNVTMLNSLLQVVGGDSPNLFLLNPNGITIGKGAAINVPGAFFLSTAESISFAENNETFSANSTSIPLLTISTPVGLQFGEERAAPIIAAREFANDLTPVTGGFPDALTFFRPGAKVALVGGDILLKEVFFRAPFGQFHIGSVGANSQVNINPDNHAVSYAPGTIFQDIEIENSIFDISAFEDGVGDASGSLSLQGREIHLRGANLNSYSFGSEDGGSIYLSASDLITTVDITPADK